MLEVSIEDEAIEVACYSLPAPQHCYTIWAVPEDAALGYHKLPLHRVRPPESYECKLHSCSSSYLLLPFCPLLHSTHSLWNVTRVISTPELYCASIMRDTVLKSRCSLHQSPGENIFSAPSNVGMIVCRFVSSQGLFYVLINYLKTYHEKASFILVMSSLLWEFQVETVGWLVSVLWCLQTQSKASKPWNRNLVCGAWFFIHFGRVTNLRKEGRGGGENMGERQGDWEGILGRGWIISLLPCCGTPILLKQPPKSFPKFKEKGVCLLTGRVQRARNVLWSVLKIRVSHSVLCIIIS